MIRTRLPLAFLIITALVIIGGVVSTRSANEVVRELDTIANQSSVRLVALGHARATAQEILSRSTAISFIKSQLPLIDDEEELEEQAEILEAEEEAVQAAQARLNNLIITYEDNVDTLEERQLAERIRQASEHVLFEAAKMIALADEGEFGYEIVEQTEEVDVAEVAFESLLNQALELEQAHLAERQSAAASTASFTLTTSYILSIGAVILAILVTVIAIRTIVNPIRRLQTTALEIEKGRLDTRATIETNNEIRTLAEAFNQMLDTLQSRNTELVNLNATLEQRVTERTSELQAATALANEASRLKDEFLAVMSHELRTPLNAILGHLGILVMFGGMTDDQERRVKRAIVNGERLLNLINDVLDISRIESGRYQLAPTRLEIRRVIADLRERMIALAEEKDLELRILIEDNVPQAVRMDEDALNKILTNLLGNAFKFTEEGSVTLHVRRDDDNLVMAVTDTGVGIPAHMHEIIFERFRQADSSTTREYGGTGLGLTIVQNLAKKMDGTATVASEPGRGATFTVTVPLQAAATEEKVIAND